MPTATKRVQSKEYRTWTNVKYRCYTPSCPFYKDYGGRGIAMHESWRNDFSAFLRDVGMAPSELHSIERLDNQKGYEPGNVCWATKKQQALNRRTTKFVEHGGMVMCLADWARHVGISPVKLNKRMKRGWSFERAIGAVA
jgi:hypothetical protein